MAARSALPRRAQGRELGWELSWALAWRPEPGWEPSWELGPDACWERGRALRWDLRSWVPKQAGLEARRRGRLGARLGAGLRGRLQDRLGAFESRSVAPFELLSAAASVALSPAFSPGELKIQPILRMSKLH